MKPEADQILNQSAAQLLGTIAPLLPAGYSQGAASLLAFMMVMAAQEYERGAEIRASENAEIRALFGEAARFVEDTALKAIVVQAAASTYASLHVSALNTANDHLRRVLIALHADIETVPGEAARGIERRIWEVLRATARRRLVRLPGG